VADGEARHQDNDLGYKEGLDPVCEELIKEGE
jgi:hypothetical protein